MDALLEVDVEARELRALYQYGYSLLLTSELDSAERIFTEVLLRAELAGLVQPHARALLSLAYVAGARGEYFLAEQQAKRALDITVAADDQDNIAYTYFQMARLDVLRGRLSDAEDKLELALMHGQLAGKHMQEANAFGLKAHCRQCLGHYADATEYYAMAESFFREIDTPANVLTCLISQVDMQFQLGDDRASQALFDQACAMDGAPNYAHSMLVLHSTRARNLALVGDAAGAQAALDETDVVGASLELDAETVLEVLTARCQCANLLGQSEHARELAEQGLRLGRQKQSRFRVAELRLELAVALTGLGCPDEAQAELLDAELAGEQFGALALQARVYSAWARLHLSVGRVQAAQAVLAQARQAAARMSPHPGRMVCADLERTAAALECAAASG